MSAARLALSLLIAVLAIGCSDDPQTDFEAENSEAFLSACTENASDDLVQQRVCACAIEEMQTSLSFDRFAAINAELEADPSAPLPTDVLEILAACVIEEADL